MAPEKKTMGIRWPVRSMMMPAVIWETMVTAWMPRGYVFIDDWEKRFLLYFSHSKRSLWKANASSMAHMTEKATRI